MKRKFLPRLLTTLICLTLLSTAALAEGDTGTTYVAQIGDTQYETFDAACNAATSDQTVITLLDDVYLPTVNTKSYALVEKSFTLDLNGHILGATSTSSSSDDLSIKIISTVTITDASGTTTGKVQGLFVDKEGSKAGNVTLADGGYVSNAQVQFGGKLIVDGGEVGTREKVDPNTERRLCVTQNGNLEVKSGKVAHLRWLSSGNSVVLSGGEFDKIESRYVDMLAEGKGYQYIDEEKNFKLSEITEKSIENVKVVTCSHDEPVDWNTEDGTCEHCGRQIYVAKSGSTGYKSVKDAIENGSSDTITLLADSDNSSNVEITNVALDLNNHSLTGSGTLTIPNESKLKITGDGTVEWKIENSGLLYLDKGIYKEITVNGGKLYLNGGSFNEIKVTDGELALKQGYALKYPTSEKMLHRASWNKSSFTLATVQVVKCSNHSFYILGECMYCATPCPHAKVDSANYRCTACHTQMAVYASKIRDEDNVKISEYFTSLNDAYKSEKCYTTMKLLANCDESAETHVGATSSIELNGHTLTALISKSGSSSLTVTDSVGTGSIGTLTLEGNADLYGGRYGKIVISVSDNPYTFTLAGFLADGYAYQSTESNNMFKLAELTGKTELTNVNVVKCPHDLEGTPCKYCGCTIVAVNNGTYYVSLSDAIAEAKAGDTVKLLGSTNGATIKDAEKFTLDLNGKQIGNHLTVENNAICVIDSATGGTINSLKTSGGLTVGDLLPEGWGFYNGTPKTWYDSSATATELDDVYVAKLPIQSVTLSSKKGSYVYGESLELSYTATKPNGGTETLTWYEVEDGTATPLAKTPDKLTFSAGTHTFRAKFTLDGYTAVSNDLTVEVGKGTLTTYDYTAPAAKTELVYTGSNQPLVTAGTVTPTGCTVKYRPDEEADWSTDIPDGQAAGDYTVYWMIDGGKNFKDVIDTTPIEVTIAPKTVTATVTIKDKIYTGLTYAEADTVTFTDGNTTYTLDADTDFDVNADFADANAGTGKAVSGTVCLTNYNYIFPNGTDELAFTATADIEKADAPTNDLMAVTLYRTAGSTEPQEISVACVGMPADAGTLSYSVPASSAYTATIDPQTGMLTVTGVSGAAGDSAHIKVNIESTNYETAEFDILVKLTDKVLPVLSVEDITTTYTGDALSHNIIKGTATVDGKTVLGGWLWNGAAPQNVADSGTISVIFTPTDTATYSPTTTNITVTINKATPPQPTFDPIDPDYDLNWLHDAGKHIDANVDFYWVEENELIVQGKEYHWRITDPNGNCEDLTGSVILWPAPASGSASGGGGGSSSSTTTKNPDGSTTVSVSSKDAKSGETVTLPVDEVNTENPSEISVEIPKNSSVTVEIPVENVTPGTVVVIVDENGNETVVATTGLTENGVTVTLTENCTIKVIENAKTFEDVPENSYYEDAVAWASAREITGGVGENNFGAENDCGRAQFVTFLWRAAGQPEAEGDHIFSDVDNDAYYTDAVKWAASLGIVSGYDTGLFGTDDTITREQMAVILYRFAQKTGLDTTQGGMAVREFSDSEEISDYAVAAIQWAVNAGVMQGYDGNLMPGAECTRAQIVTMLYRLLGK